MTFFAVLTALAIDNMTSVLIQPGARLQDLKMKELVSLRVVDVSIALFTPLWLHIIDSMRFFSLQEDPRDDFHRAFSAFKITPPERC